MTQQSLEFERQIARIESLIAAPGREVQWNDRIPDPDNPTRMRQIDISIRTDSSLTLVECRLHAQPQDVQWVEELIGRRASLQANTVIAVSASGFTQGAIKKAKAFGVILRDMKSLTEEEVQSWGKTTDLTVEILHFSNTALIFEFEKAEAHHVRLEDVERQLAEQNLALGPIFDLLVDQMRAKNPNLPPVTAAIRVKPKSMTVLGKPVVGIRVRTDFNKELRNLSTSSVVAYDTPEKGALERNAFVEIVNLGKFEIAHSADVASIAIDMSSFDLPLGAKVGRLETTFSRPVEVREFVLLGFEGLGFHLGPFDLAIAFI